MLKEDQIEACIRWLQNNASTPVKYLTHLNLLKENPNSRDMRRLRAEVEDGPESVEMFSKQEADGSWCAGGSWAPKPSYIPAGGYTPVSPKYVTTVWMLSILGDMGYTIRDERVRRACEYTLTFQRPNGVLSETRRPPTEEDYDVNPRNVPCRMSVQLTGLVKVGFGDDPRVRKALDLLLGWRRDDGGWLQEGHRDGTASPYRIWDRSCPWSTYYATTALYYSGIPRYRQEASTGLSFLLWHLDGKKEDEIRRFYWHGHEMVKELLMLSELGFDKGRRSIRLLLEWLETMHDAARGCFTYAGKPVSKMRARVDGGDPRVMRYRLFHMIERDWLTYYATRIFRNYM